MKASCSLIFRNNSLCEGPEGVKWELGLAGFVLGKWGSSHWDWDLVTGNGKKMLKIKNRNGILEFRSEVWKKNELGNGIGNPPSGPSCV